MFEKYAECRRSTLDEVSVYAEHVSSTPNEVRVYNKGCKRYYP